MGGGGGGNTCTVQQINLKCTKSTPSAYEMETGYNKQTQKMGCGKRKSHINTKSPSEGGMHLTASPDGLPSHWNLFVLTSGYVFS